MSTISVETGIRLSSDINFPEDRKIRLKFFLTTPVAIEATLRWKKPIGINNYINGLESSPTPIEAPQAYSS